MLATEGSGLLLGFPVPPVEGSDIIVIVGGCQDACCKLGEDSDELVMDWHEKSDVIGKRQGIFCTQQ